MNNRRKRQVVFYKRYFLDFYEFQKKKVQVKIEWTLGLIQDIEIVPEKYLKHIEGAKGLYEIRVQVGSNIYRVFCFFDEGDLIVLGNAFQKKTQKTPKEQIIKALKIMGEYYNEKE
jgi:phage-related protein